MPADPSARSPRALTAAVATCALGLAVAAPGVARPAGLAPAQSAEAVYRAHQQPADQAQTSSLAGTTEANLADRGIAPSGDRARITAPDEDGTTTLAVVLIAGGALFAGASAGFAGGRRMVLRTN
jgi:hypothetical protein